VSKFNTGSLPLWGNPVGKNEMLLYKNNPYKRCQQCHNVFRGFLFVDWISLFRQSRICTREIIYVAKSN